MELLYSTCLSIKNISIYVDLNFAGLNRKAIRQKWLYTEKRAAGSPTRLYYIDALPDEIQSIWAGWDIQQEQEAHLWETAKGDKARPDIVPSPVTFEQAEIALGWPERKTWKAEKGKKWDGKSRGLCPEAREKLITRFPELKCVQAGTVELPAHPGELIATRSPAQREMVPFVQDSTAEVVMEPPGNMYKATPTHDGTVLSPEGSQKNTNIPDTGSWVLDARDREIELLKEMLNQKDQMIRLLQGTLTDKENVILQQKEIIEMKNQVLKEKEQKINLLKRDLTYR